MSSGSWMRISKTKKVFRKLWKRTTHTKQVFRKLDEKQTSQEETGTNQDVAGRSPQGQLILISKANPPWKKPFLQVSTRIFFQNLPGNSLDEAILKVQVAGTTPPPPDKSLLLVWISSNSLSSRRGGYLQC